MVAVMAAEEDIIRIIHISDNAYWLDLKAIHNFLRVMQLPAKHKSDLQDKLLLRL